jgi:hypothetical protein
MTKDQTQAVEYFNCAITFGNTQVILYLRFCDQSGDLVQQKFSNAVEYCTRTSTLGNVEVILKLENIQ